MLKLITRRPNVAAALLLLVIAVALFVPYLTQPNHLMWPRSELGTDMLTYNWPTVYFFREALRQYGEIPLWQGTSAGGLPMVGNPAVRLFYPPQLLMSLLPIPILWGYALLNVFHFWLAGMGSYGLARSVLKVDYPAALLAGLLVMLTPRLSSNVVGDAVYTHGLCWLPLCLLWTRLAFDRRSWRWGMAAGLAMACIYLNNIQFILYTGWLVGLYFLYCCIGLIRDRRPVREWLQTGGILLVIMAATIGFAAYQALPFISYLPYQSRQAMTLADANYLALPPVGLMNTLFPIAQKFPEWEVYAGLLPLILAPLAMLHPARREKWWWFALLVFAVLFSVGSATPLYTAMFYGVPGFGLLRVPARMWYVAAIALAMLAALAVDVVLAPLSPSPFPRVQGKGSKRRIDYHETHSPTTSISALLSKGVLSRRWWRWLVGSSSIFIIITLAGRYLTRRPDEMDWVLGMVTSAGLVLTLVALWRWQQGKLRPSALVAVLGAAVLMDLFPLDMAFGRPRPMDDFTQTPAIVQKMIGIAGDGVYRVYSTRREITDRVAVLNNLQTADGLNSFQFGSYAQFMRVASGCDLEGLAAAIPACVSNEISETAYEQAKPDPALLGLLNVRYVISTVDLENDALRLVATEGQERLYENLAVLPRAFAVGKAELIEANNLITRLHDIGEKPIALLDGGQQRNFELPNNNFHQEAAITRYTSNQIVVAVDMPDNGVLVLSDPWTPGWVAEVDGQATQVLRVDGTLRGVYLTAGKHSVVFIFYPPALTTGLTISIITVIVGVIIGVTSVVKRRV